MHAWLCREYDQPMRVIWGALLACAMGGSGCASAPVTVPKPGAPVVRGLRDGHVTIDTCGSQEFYVVIEALWEVVGESVFSVEFASWLPYEGFDSLIGVRVIDVPLRDALEAIGRDFDLEIVDTDDGPHLRANLARRLRFRARSYLHGVLPETARRYEFGKPEKLAAGGWKATVLYRVRFDDLRPAGVVTFRDDETVVGVEMKKNLDLSTNRRY